MEENKKTAWKKYKSIIRKTKKENIKGNDKLEVRACATNKKTENMKPNQDLQKPRRISDCQFQKMDVSIIHHV